MADTTRGRSGDRAAMRVIAARLLAEGGMDLFDYEYARIAEAMRKIESLRRRRDVTDDNDVQLIFDYEISEQEKIVRMMRAHIVRESHR